MWCYRVNPGSHIERLGQTHEIPGPGAPPRVFSLQQKDVCSGNVVLYQDAAMTFYALYTKKGRSRSAQDLMSDIPNCGYVNSGFGLLEIKEALRVLQLVLPVGWLRKSTDGQDDLWHVPKSTEFVLVDRTQGV